jgi:simple sugar transport system permease protein/ribose transport system permease protein
MKTNQELNPIKESELHSKNKKLFREFGILMVLAVIFVALSIASPSFLIPINLINIVRQTVEIGIMAIGMTFIIIAGEIDLSVGSIFGATAMFAAVLFQKGTDPTLTFFFAIAMGSGIGFINGFLSTKAKMPSFIVTLGILQLFRSVAYGISNGRSISSFPDSATNSWVFGFGGNIGIIPVQVIILVAFLVVAHFILKKTKLGFDTYATGGNKKAALLAGINIDRVKMICFIIAGALCSFAGLISIAYLQSVPTTAGQGREMDVIAAVILGGAALTGGRGSILGTAIGALIMSIIKNGMVLLGVPAFWQTGFIGAVIILAVLLDTRISRSNSFK